ncbi:uncharacterized protein [Atheta coriaria]
MFLLNQVLFSVMFFQNYDQELIESTPNETISVKELSLTEDLFLTCLKPDDALSLVNKHVQFCASHGVNKGKVSPLVSNRIFVIHENIQVVADAENHYANIDRPSLTAQVVEKHRQGYVRLKYIEDLKFKTSISSNSSSMTTSDDTCSLDDGSETYGRITKAMRIRPLPKMDPNRIKKSLYPICEVKRRNYDALDDEDLWIHEYFVNSKAMKDQFHRNWPNIAKLLELDSSEIETGFNCDSIHCRSKCRDISWEIIPAVQLPKGAYEYFLKIKSNYIKSQVATHKGRVFPNEEMLNEIVHMDRLAIPRGFIPKYKGETNPNCHLEWELAHPKVEKYLQQQLTHTHVRTLLLMLVILKTFVEPKTKHNGVTIRHLVIHLFWELQKDVVINDTRMGARLVQMINSFCSRLSKSSLPDYFVQERNHFENIPSEHIRNALEMFARTRDKPLIHFMTAIRNLQYRDETFPQLDVKKLHEILTKSMAPVRKKPMEPRRTKLDWEGMIREKTRRETVVVKNLTPERKVSVDSILESNIIGISLEPSEESPHYSLKRSREVIVFFLDHYIKMAASLYNLGNLKQALSYLRQAELLTYLFHLSCGDDASKYQKTIKALRSSFEEGPEKRSLMDVEHRRKSLPPSTLPDLPQRSPSVHIPPIRVVNQNSVDISKVLHQHQNGDVRGKIFRKRKESESTLKSASSDDSDIDEVILRHPPEEKQRVLRRRNESDPSEKENQKKIEMLPRKTKSVNFNTEVVIGKDTNIPKVNDKLDHVNPIVTVINSSANETSDNSDTSTIVTESEEEEEDLDGLDELIDDEIDSRDTIVQVTNPFGYHANRISLGYEPEDTFT